MVNENQTFLTKDLYEAAFLLSHSKKFLGLEPKDNGSFFFFKFEDSLACQQQLQPYWSGDASINAQKFVHALQTLKTQLNTAKAQS